MILLLCALAFLFFFNSIVLAQSGTVLDLGGGISTFSDSSGRSGTIIDLGGGMKSYSDNHGVSGTILDLGGGTQSYNFTSPPGAAMTPFTPSRSTPMGFDEKYQRDYNIFNPANKYTPDNPLNPAQSYSPDNPFNPANQYNPNNPLNPANRYNPNTHFAPLSR